MKSFTEFHEELKNDISWYAVLYVCFPIGLHCLKHVQQWLSSSDTTAGDKLLRQRRVYLWIQQGGFALVSLALLLEHVQGASTLPVEPDLIMSGLIALSLLFDNALRGGDRYLRASWLPLYGMLMLYMASKALAHPSTVRAATALLCSCSGLVSCLHLVINIEVPQLLVPPDEYTCGLITFCLFSFVTKPILLLALRKGFLTIDDVPGLVHHDSCNDVFRRISQVSKQASLMYKVFLPVRLDTLKSGVYQFISSVLNFATPLALGRIVSHVSSLGSSDESGKLPDDDTFGGVNIPVNAAVGILLVAPAMKAIIDGQWLSTGRHMGIRIKAAVISLIFNKALTVDLTATSDGIGKLNNMISVDAQAIQNFMCYCHQIWSAFLEIFLAISLLYMVLGKAAFAGVIAMVFSVPSCFYLTKRMTYYQDQLLQRKDARMSAVSEVLNSVRIIKLFAWECRFEEQVKSLRANELLSLRCYMYSMAGMGVMWDAIPTIVALITFLYRSYYLNESMTPAQGYAGLMMFTLLKRPLATFPEMSGWCINAYVAIQRIASFLAVDNISGFRNALISNAAADMAPAITFNHASFGWNAVLENSKDDQTVTAQTARASMSERLWRRIQDGGVMSLVPSSVPTHSYIELEMIAPSEAERDGWIDEGIDIEAVGGDNAPVMADVNVILHDVHSVIEKGSLCAIIGPTGSGKSTLLAGLFGECKTGSSSCVSIEGTVSYAPQLPWIQQATIRENILFGTAYDPARYTEVVRACALDVDLAGLPDGDMTEIGEKGVNLSGGQKQRVSLARAAYSGSDIVVMDDVLSAVDAHVGEHIFRNLICGFLKSRTRLLVTHQLALVLSKADTVLCLRPAGLTGPVVSSEKLHHADISSTRIESSVLAACPPEDLVSALQASPMDISHHSASDGFITYLKTLAIQGTPKVLSETSVLSSESHVSFARINGANLDGIALDDTFFCDEEAGTVELVGRKRMGSLSSEIDSQLGSNCSYDHLKCLGKSNFDLCNTVEISHYAKGKSIGIVTKEDKSRGSVSWSVYWYYLNAAGGSWFAPGLLAVMMWAAASWYFQNYSLGQWLIELEKEEKTERDANKKLVIFISCCLSVVASVLVKNMYIVFGSLRASQALHNMLVTAVLSATCSWFDSTPIGRITNRFSTDIDEIDKEMMFTLQFFIDCVFGTLQVFIAIAVTVPFLLVTLTPIMLYIWWCAFLFVQGSREMKRLESVHKSPVFVLFSETLSGLSTIRSFGHEKRFFDACIRHTDNMNRCHIYLWMCNRWLACRMQLSGAVVGGAVGYAVIKNASQLGGAAAGLVLVFALNLTDNLTFMARLYADCQMNLNSVERLQEYAYVPSEKYSGSVSLSTQSNASHFLPSPSSINVSPDWPSAGVVEFRDVVLKYESAPEPVLKGVSFLIPSKKKVGIVGRTGAGKSSLLVALFRVVEPSRGSVLIDDVNALSLPLHTLRSRLSIVPQDPILFKGSIRSNLDPFGEKEDTALWDALQRVRMATHVASMKGGTGKAHGPLSDKLVADHGSNLSVGQRQLLCMARAILRGATVLVMDEATANVDPQTDILIQETVRTEFQDCTVLCIAHRLHTVAHCDLVLVMDKGEIAEFDAPSALLNNEQSLFFGMCKTSGDFEELQQVLNNIHNDSN